jgi:hypothetical protein
MTGIWNGLSTTGVLDAWIHNFLLSVGLQVRDVVLLYDQVLGVLM